MNKNLKIVKALLIVLILATVSFISCNDPVDPVPIAYDTLDGVSAINVTNGPSYVVNRNVDQGISSITASGIKYSFLWTSDSTLDVNVTGLAGVPSHRVVTVTKDSMLSRFDTLRFFYGYPRRMSRDNVNKYYWNLHNGIYKMDSVVMPINRLYLQSSNIANPYLTIEPEVWVVLWDSKVDLVNFFSWYEIINVRNSALSLSNTYGYQYDVKGLLVKYLKNGATFISFSWSTILRKK